MDVFWVQHGRYVELGYVHNLIGAVAAETGVIGLFLLTAAVTFWLREAQPWKAMPVEQLGCAITATFIFGSSLVSGDYYDTRWMWIFAVLAVNPSARGADLPLPCSLNRRVPLTAIR
jgi:hypothetical protein